MFIYLCLKRVDVSMVVMCDASDITGYDKRRSELSNEPLNTKQDH